MHYKLVKNVVVINGLIGSEKFDAVTYVNAYISIVIK